MIDKKAFNLIVAGLVIGLILVGVLLGAIIF